MADRPGLCPRVRCALHSCPGRVNLPATDVVSGAGHRPRDWPTAEKSPPISPWLASRMEEKFARMGVADGVTRAYHGSGGVRFLGLCVRFPLASSPRYQSHKMP